MSDFEKRITLLAVVTGNSLQRSSKQGTPSVAIRYQTLYDIEEPSVPYKVSIIDNLWLTYKTVDRTTKTLQEVFGWKGVHITDFEQPILVGKKANLVCELEEWEGNERLKVVFTNRAGGFKKLEAQDLTALVNDVQPMLDKVLGRTSDETGPDGPELADAQFEELGDGTAPADDDGMPF